MIVRTAPDEHVWLRIVRPYYRHPFDPSHAQRRGGRWNPPDSWPTLYLNEDMATVHAQVRHMFVGRGIDPDDLDDDAPIHLAAATLPQRQRVVDVLSDAGVAAVGLPATYPLDATGHPVDQSATRAIGVRAHEAGHRGVWCRSASLVGRELAWFPAARSAARPVWSAPKRFGAWRHVVSLGADGGLTRTARPGRGRPGSG
ncbi:MAG: RES family NAD+ phosphorylase [Ilumatobacteraceae bacterium]